MGECPQMTTEVAPGPQAQPQAQAVTAPLTGAAIFLVVTIEPGAESCAAVRDLFGELAALLRAVGFRDLDAKLSCVVGIGSEAWERLGGPAHPAGAAGVPGNDAGSPHPRAAPGRHPVHIPPH